ncbi:MAG: hypothetical protein ACREHG_00850 [Candidatus Saccharimonadales bacterium]
MSNLKLENLEVRAAFVGYTNPSHADAVIAYSKDNPDDWINDWLQNENEQEQPLAPQDQNQSQETQSPNRAAVVSAPTIASMPETSITKCNPHFSLFLKSSIVSLAVSAGVAIDSWLRVRGDYESFVPIGFIVGFYALIAFVIAFTVTSLALIVRSHNFKHMLRYAITIIFGSVVLLVALWFLGFASH